MGLIEFTAFFLGHELVHVHGIKSQHRHHVRERVQHYVCQRDVQLFVSYHENRWMKKKYRVRVKTLEMEKSCGISILIYKT